MSNANLGWLFYKDYFKGLDYIALLDKKNDKNNEYIKQKVNALTKQQYVPREEEVLGSTRFQATTSYPGLILGSGNAHELPGVEGQAILGFHFDYTSGLPVIQGSSIKGVIKSAFKHPEYIKSLLHDATCDVKALEKEIFENADIFYDAHIIKADAYDRILGDDYITPHDDVLKDPKPLRFIKVLPDVTFLFEFELSDDSLLCKSEKETLFKQILSDLGLGAKTNVGYGKFTAFKKGSRTAEEEEQDKKDAARRAEEVRLQREAELEAKREAKAEAEAQKKQRLEREKQEALEQAQAKKEALASQGLAEILNEVKKYKALEAVLKKYIDVKALDDDEKIILEEHILTNINEKIKRKKFPFGVVGDEKCLGKERANTLADKLGLK